MFARRQAARSFATADNVGSRAAATSLNLSRFSRHDIWVFTLRYL